MPSFDLSTTFCQAQGLLSSAIDEEVVLLDMAAEKYYGMDAVASRIWELLAQPRSLGEVCDLLMQEFKIDHPTCERDVLDFVGQLATTHLVDIHDR